MIRILLRFRYHGWKREVSDMERGERLGDAKGGTETRKGKKGRPKTGNREAALTKSHDNHKSQVVGRKEGGETEEPTP
jgi:hypothetical protein